MREYVQVNFGFFGHRPFHCYVRPRYSGGSPAMVPDHIALQVAREEREGYEHAREGVYGEAQKKRAEVLGLRGTAYAMAEKGSGKNFRWLVYDLVTGEHFERLHENEICKLGFKPYVELSGTVKEQINKTGREEDYERTYWKFEDLHWVQYHPRLVRVEAP